MKSLNYQYCRRRLEKLEEEEYLLREAIWDCSMDAETATIDELEMDLLNCRLAIEFCRKEIERIPFRFKIKLNFLV